MRERQGEKGADCAVRMEQEAGEAVVSALVLAVFRSDARGWRWSLSSRGVAGHSEPGRLESQPLLGPGLLPVCTGDGEGLLGRVSFGDACCLPAVHPGDPGDPTDPGSFLLLTA